MGLKIVQALLTNETVWQISLQKFPILVVCYTNHALDQFLEGNVYAKLVSIKTFIVEPLSNFSSFLLLFE